MVEEFEPTWPYLWYGDGHWAECRGKKEQTNKLGIEGWEFLINPSSAIIKQFDLRWDRDLDNRGYARKWYPRTKVFVLRDSAVSGRILITTDFNGKDTSFSRKDAYYTEQLQDYQQMIKILRAGKAKLYEEINMMMTQLQKYITQQTNMVREVKRATSSNVIEESQLGSMDEPTKQNE